MRHNIENPFQANSSDNGNKEGKNIGYEEGKDKKGKQEKEAELKADSTKTWSVNNEGKDIDFSAENANGSKKPGKSKNVSPEKINWGEEIPDVLKENKDELEDNFLSQYGGGYNYSSEDKEKINEEIEREYRQTKIDFAKQWLNGNMGKAKGRGYSLKIKEDKYLVNIVKEMGGFDEIKNEDKYKGEREKIERLSILKRSWGEGAISVESQFLMLNNLDKNFERLSKEMKDMEDSFEKEKMKGEKPSFRESKVYAELREERKKVFEIEKKISSKLIDRDVVKEADEKIELSSKDDIISFKDKNGNLKKLRVGVKNIDDCATKLRYRVELKGKLGSRKIEIIDRGENVVKEFKDRHKADKFLKKEIKNKLEERPIKEIIKELSGSLEKAEGGIGAVYNRAKERLEKEFVFEKCLRKAKTPEERKKIENEFKGKGVDVENLIKEISNPSELSPLEEIVGDIKEDKDKIKGFLDDGGIDISDEEIEDYFQNNSLGKRYRQKVRTKLGFIEWLFGLLSSTF